MDGCCDIVDEKTMELYLKAADSVTVVGVEPGFKQLLLQIYRNAGNPEFLTLPLSLLLTPTRTGMQGNTTECTARWTR